MRSCEAEQELRLEAEQALEAKARSSLEAEIALTKQKTIALNLLNHVYYKIEGDAIVILLAGGDKSTQTRDIKIALKLARTI